MYLSNVRADTVEVDSPIGNAVNLDVKVAKIQFAFPRNPLTRKKVNKGMPKTPTAKSTKD